MMKLISESLWLQAYFHIFSSLSLLIIDQLHLVGIYHFLKAHNFPEFLGYVI